MEADKQLSKDTFHAAGLKGVDKLAPQDFGYMQKRIRSKKYFPYHCR